MYQDQEKYHAEYHDTCRTKPDITICPDHIGFIKYNSIQESVLSFFP